MENLATFQEVLIKAIKDGHGNIVSANQSMVEISKSTKRKPAFIKIGLQDEDATGYIMSKNQGFLLTFDGDILNKIADEIDLNPQHEHTTKGE